MDNALISVIVPVYNAASFIEKCVHSIQAQTHENLEIILVNDGSRDNSGEVCDALSREDKRIKMIHKENGGASSARNAGLDVAQGAYVAFVDSDDTIQPDMYARLYQRILESNTDICVCGYNMLYDNYMRVVKAPGEVNLTRIDLWNYYLSDYRTYFPLFSGPWNKLYNMDVVQAIRFPTDMRNWEDAWFVIDCIKVTEKGISLLSPALYNYSQMSNLSSLSKNIANDDTNKMLMRLKETMQQALPHKSENIERLIVCQQYVHQVAVAHTAITIYNQPPPVKPSWKQLRVILRDSTSAAEKASAVLMCVLPRPLYRYAFKMFCKLGMD